MTSSAEWDRRYAGSDLVWTDEANRFVAAELAGLAPGRALDLGCGEGRNAVWLAARGWRVTGVDFSAVALDKARSLAAARGVDVDWVCADVLTHAVDPAGYDLVLLAYLQLPADGRRRVLRTAAGALAPGGTLLVVAHDLANLDGGVGGPRDPDVLYTPEWVTGELAGLPIGAARRVDRPVEGGTAIDTLVRAVRPGAE